MESVVLVIHLILALAIIALVLLQRSEGGGLGIGGGGGMGSLASPHSTASVLTKITQICAACFFCTSLVLAILAGGHQRSTDILDRLDEPVAATEAAAESVPAPPIEEENIEDIPEPSVPVSE